MRRTSGAAQTKRRPVGCRFLCVPEIQVGPCGTKNENRQSHPLLHQSGIVSTCILQGWCCLNDKQCCGAKYPPFAQGRKNWYLNDAVGGTKSSAIAYSSAEAAKANNLKLYEYFKYLLEELPKHGEFEAPFYLDELLLWLEKLPECCRKKQ